MSRYLVALAVITGAFALAAPTAYADRDSISDLLIQPDGKIVAVGEANGEFIGPSGEFGIARYTASGSLDPTFSEDGILTESLGAGGKARAVARQPDGKLVVVGSCCTGEGGISSEPAGLAVIRLNPDGTLDSTFSEDGKMTVFLGLFAEATSVTIEPGGAILVAGGQQGGGSGFVRRLTSSGQPDTTFSEDGTASVPLGTAWAMARQSDGKIVVAGESGLEHFFAARLKSDGSVDETFGSGGKTEEGPAGYADAEAVAIQADGKIVTAGSAGDAYTNDYAVARYTTAGVLDSSFSGDGIATQSVGTFDVANSLAIQPDGSLLVGGEEFGSFAVTRFSGTGTVDSGFATAGVLLDHPEADGRALALDSDGSFLVGGATDCCHDDSQFLISRYNSAGVKVSAFGTNGDVTTNFDGDEGDPPPDGGLPPTTGGTPGPVGPPVPALTPRRPTNCRKGFVRKKVSGKKRCVKKPAKKKHKRR